MIIVPVREYVRSHGEGALRAASASSVLENIRKEADKAPGPAG